MQEATALTRPDHNRRMIPVPPDQISVVLDGVRRVSEDSVLVHHDHAHTIVDIEHAWLRRVVRHPPSCEKTGGILLLSFAYVCPEPVLVKCSVSV
jgi:hypothetical protein